jgi:O-acetylhomoserine/O-acetylserine sulfhydrylase-like pyridoxal-dependent enzyme
MHRNLPSHTTHSISLTSAQVNVCDVKKWVLHLQTLFFQKVSADFENLVAFQQHTIRFQKAKQGTA